MPPRKAAGRSARPTKTTKSKLIPETQRGTADVEGPFSLPSRFKVVSEGDKSGVLLHDTETGNDVQVATREWGGVRRVLAILFGAQRESPPRLPFQASLAAIATPRAAGRYRIGSDANRPPTSSGAQTMDKSAAKPPAKPARPPQKARIAPGTASVPAPGSGARPPGRDSSAIPPGFEAEISGKGFRLLYGKDPKTNRDAYRVEVNGQNVGWLRKEDERRWVLYSPTDAFPRSVHRNVMGAHTRIETIYEPRS